MLPDEEPDFRFPFPPPPFVVVVVVTPEFEEVEFGLFLLFVDMVSVLSIAVAVFISVTSTVVVVLEGSLGEELFDAITDEVAEATEVGLEIEILIGTAVEVEIVDFEFDNVGVCGTGATPTPESGAVVLKRSSVVVLLEVLEALPLSLSVVTRNTVLLS